MKVGRRELPKKEKLLEAFVFLDEHVMARNRAHLEATVELPGMVSLIALSHQDVQL